MEGEISVHVVIGRSSRQKVNNKGGKNSRGIKSYEQIKHLVAYKVFKWISLLYRNTLYLAGYPAGYPVSGQSDIRPDIRRAQPDIRPDTG